MLFDFIGNHAFLIAIIAIIIAVIALLIFSYLYNPFEYPHVIVNFDISGKKQPKYDEYIDDWILKADDHHQMIKDEFHIVLDDWDDKCKLFLNHCLLWKGHREELYENMRHQVVADDYRMFQFIFFRNQTRYRQQNYVKESYKVQVEEYRLEYSLKNMFDIDDELNSINYQTTRIKYQTKNQRKLMTKELKDKIKKRDNYTCQICGKYMPDEVGLHIDHIIAIKNGGKSVEDNLQVLCDKCNLKKGSGL